MYIYIDTTTHKKSMRWNQCGKRRSPAGSYRLEISKNETELRQLKQEQIVNLTMISMRKQLAFLQTHSPNIVQTQADANPQMNSLQ